MKSRLTDYQKLASDQLKTGSILLGGVGSGKTRTAVYYYITHEKPKDLYIITTALKRDTLDWQRECAIYAIGRDRTASVDGIQVTVDSWNNIKKYVKIKHAFFIFDEQRVVGSGAWVRSFLKITKNNNWILLTATPADKWMDLAPVFVANGFYKNRTEFTQRHVVYKHFVNFPMIDKYLEEDRLERLRNKITVVMNYEKATESVYEHFVAPYNKEMYEEVVKKRWDPYENKPIRNASAYCYILRRIVNSDPSRINEIEKLIIKYRKLIVFYNFNYELDILRKLNKDYTIAEHNGQKHEPVPTTESWVYLVQYMSGSEGWNCIETNALVFYSLNYSYRIMTQSAGRIDRMNTPYAKLFYFMFTSKSSIDRAIIKALANKKSFNIKQFVKF